MDAEADLTLVCAGAPEHSGPGICLHTPSSREIGLVAMITKPIPFYCYSVVFNEQTVYGAMTYETCDFVKAAEMVNAGVDLSAFVTQEASTRSDAGGAGYPQSEERGRYQGRCDPVKRTLIERRFNPENDSLTSGGSKKMKSLLSLAAKPLAFCALAALVSLGVPGQSRADDVLTLKLGHIQSEKDLWHFGAEKFKEELEARSNGKITSGHLSKLHIGWGPRSG